MRIDRVTEPRTTAGLGLWGVRPSSAPTALGRTWADAAWIGADLAACAVDLQSGRVTESRPPVVISPADGIGVTDE